MMHMRQSAAIVSAPGRPGMALAPDPGQAIAVDIDGSLLRTDLLYECLALLLREKPWCLFLLPFWLLGGKARLKREIARRVDLDIDTLPVNEPLLEWLEDRQAEGVRLGLFSASDNSLVQRVAARFAIFSEVQGSDGTVNLAGANKLAAIRERFGDDFTYVGDGGQDIAIWEGCRSAVLAGPRASALRARLAESVEVVHAFEHPGVKLRTWAKALRVHQWAKNLLLLVPFLLAGELPTMESVAVLVPGFLAFSLLASLTYLLNDLFDLSADRRHRSKRNRPLASGALPIRSALLAIPVLGLAVVGLLALTTPAFVAVTATYLVLTLAYSFGLKRRPMLDVVVLAILFTLRILAGIVAQDGPWSPWLLTFSMFFFTSLAVMKRYSECRLLAREGKEKARGRGYNAGDAPVLLGMGMAAGFCAPLVFFSYLVDMTSAVRNYAHPEFLWVICVILAYWLGRAWLLAGRGEMHDDPVVFALKDRASLAMGAATALLVVVAAKGDGLAKLAGTMLRL